MNSWGPVLIPIHQNLLKKGLKELTEFIPPGPFTVDNYPNNNQNYRNNT